MLGSNAWRSGFGGYYAVAKINIYDLCPTPTVLLSSSYAVIWCQDSWVENKTGEVLKGNIRLDSIAKSAVHLQRLTEAIDFQIFIT